MSPHFSRKRTREKWGTHSFDLSYGVQTVQGFMRRSIYNFDIPDRTFRTADLGAASFVRLLWFGLLVVCLLKSFPAFAADWTVPEQQLARKIVAVTGPGTVALTFENHSSLGRRDSDIIQNGLRSALGQAGIRFATPEQAAASITISLSENLSSYVWVAEIHQTAAESAVVMVSAARSGRFAAARDSMPITLNKTLLWTQNDRILDVATLEESSTPTRIAVLSAENVSFYRWIGGKWQGEQVLTISHSKPWPLDLRGRLLLTKDRLLDAYLPGVVCHSNTGSTTALNCREGDDPWPISQALMFGSNSTVPNSSSSGATATPNLSAFFASTRNFFNGIVTPAIGKFSTVPKFYSAAFVPRERYSLWLFAGTDGKVHLVDGMSDQPSLPDWGSDIATLKTSCGAGWQVLATGASRDGDFVRSYEFPDRDAVAVSPVVEFSGNVSALWTESRGDSAIAIVNNRETGSYEAYRLGVACNQ
jgi:hypothetical protein